MQICPCKQIMRKFICLLPLQRSKLSKDVWTVRDAWWTLVWMVLSWMFRLPLCQLFHNVSVPTPLPP